MKVFFIFLAYYVFFQIISMPGYRGPDYPASRISGMSSVHILSRSAYHGVVKVEIDLAAAGLVVGLRDGQHVQVPPLHDS